MQNSAYGASFAGGAIDLTSFFKKPQTILRIISWLFSIVVFATITAEGYINLKLASDAKCMFNQNDSACSYGVGVGVLAFLACVIFFLLDAYFPQISNARDRKYIVIGDLGFSAAWTFLWFVCFCVLASQWAKTNVDATQVQLPDDAARACIAFSFFSIISWGLLTFFALGRYKQGLTDLNQDYTDPANDHTSSGYPNSGVPTGYQQSPFAGQGPTGAGEYNPPSY